MACRELGFHVTSALPMPGEGCTFTGTEDLPQLTAGESLPCFKDHREALADVVLARDTCQLVSTASVSHLPRDLPSAQWRGGKAELPFFQLFALWVAGAQREVLWLLFNTAGQTGRERFQRGKLCLCTSFCIQTSTVCACSVKLDFEGT